VRPKITIIIAIKIKIKKKFHIFIFFHICTSWVKFLFFLFLFFYTIVTYSNTCASWLHRLYVRQKWRRSSSRPMRVGTIFSASSGIVDWHVINVPFLISPFSINATESDFFGHKRDHKFGRKIFGNLEFFKPFLGSISEICHI